MATSPSRADEGAKARSSLAWIDVLRIAAIVAVATIHTLSAARNAGVRLHSAGWWTADALNAAVIWAVPVFVMISGALLLDPRRTEPAGRFLRRRVERIGVPLVFWTLFYVGYRRWYLHQPLTVATAWHEVLAGRPFIQLYYLFIIAGLYLVTPLLREVWRPLSQPQRALVATAALGFGAVDRAIVTFAHLGSENAVTEFVPYVGYYLAGSVLREWRLPAHGRRALVRRLGWVFLGGCLLTAGAAGALTFRYGNRNPAFYVFDHLSPTVIVMAVAVFALGRVVLGDRPGSPWLRTVGVATFGVYLVHPVVLYWLLNRIHPAPTTLVAIVPVIALVAVAVSLAVTLVIQRVPFVDRVVGGG